MKLITLVNRYIEYRKSLGDKYRTNEKILMTFCSTVRKNVDVHRISNKCINKFFYGNGKITGNWFVKYATLSGFYNYVISRGYINHSPLPKNIPKRPPSFVPYIYTREELRRIFKISLIYPKQKTHIRPYMIHVLLILLYCAGLRLGEALSLTMADVDVTKSTILIRSTKFNKFRIVPYGKYLAKVITKYILWRKNQGIPKNDASPFFINPHGEIHISPETVRGVFHRIIEIANLKPTDKSKHQPRLNDFRHSFAVHCLTCWYQNNSDVQKLLPILSVYMGHADISATSVYLTMTDDLLRLANSRFKRYAIGGVS